MSHDEPRTEAGRRFVEDYFDEVPPADIGRVIAAIEAEARAALLAELREKVEALPHFPGHVMRPPNADRWLDRAAVLALLADTETAG